MFSDYFPISYCINLSRRPDRWEQASKEFITCGVPVKRFEAIDANDFKIEYPMKASACACMLSHLQIIERCKAYGLDKVFIFEDDVVFRNGFNQIFDEAIRDVPDNWELLYFGGSHQVKPEKVTDKIYRVTKTLTTHAFGIRAAVFDEILKFPHEWTRPIDCVLTEIQKRGNSYVVNPPIAFQREGFSDVEGRNMNYDWIQKTL